MDTLTKTDARRDTPGRVVAAPLPWTPPAPPQKNWWVLGFSPVIVLAVLGLLLGRLSLPYVSISPGGADPINQLVSVPADKRHPPKGSFLLTTVALDQTIGLVDFVRDFFDDDTVLIAKKQILGDSTPQQYSQQAAQDMTDSKTAAAVVAMRALGYDVVEKGEGALIINVLEGNDVPANGLLVPGDAITAVDGVPTPLAQNAIDALSKHRPGDSVNVTVVQKSDGASVSKTIKLGTRTEDSCTLAVFETTATGCLGVSLGTKSHDFDFPFDVKIDTAGIGGPSAGLAFALALIDELTPGELTGGKNVAVTGTIDVEGTVGDVGGVVQKTAAVRNSGATLFLVPPGEFEQAKSHAGSKLKVVQVRTLSDALTALAQNGGEPVKLATGAR
ncbi:MAG: PDZ domain-containing protein [Acidimicrobiales bacterium]|nr:PDZ domain-containing protein [Acidimicrobiales bacterium]